MEAGSAEVAVVVDAGRLFDGALGELRSGLHYPLPDGSALRVIGSASDGAVGVELVRPGGGRLPATLADGKRYVVHGDGFRRLRAAELTPELPIVPSWRWKPQTRALTVLRSGVDVMAGDAALAAGVDYELGYGLLRVVRSGRDWQVELRSAWGRLLEVMPLRDGVPVTFGVGDRDGPLLEATPVGSPKRPAGPFVVLHRPRGASVATDAGVGLAPGRPFPLVLHDVVLRADGMLELRDGAGRSVETCEAPGFVEDNDAGRGRSRVIVDDNGFRVQYRMSQAAQRQRSQAGRGPLRTRVLNERLRHAGFPAEDGRVVSHLGTVVEMAWVPERRDEQHRDVWWFSNGELRMSSAAGVLRPGLAHLWSGTTGYADWAFSLRAHLVDGSPVVDVGEVRARSHVDPADIVAAIPGAVRTVERQLRSERPHDRAVAPDSLLRDRAVAGGVRMPVGVAPAAAPSTRELRTAPVFRVDNVVEYYAARVAADDQPIDPARDFPMLAPPFEQFLLEAAFPGPDGALDAAGLLCDAVELTGSSAAVPEVFADAAVLAVAAGARWLLVGRLLVESPVGAPVVGPVALVGVALDELGRPVVLGEEASPRWLTAGVAAAGHAPEVSPVVPRLLDRFGLPLLLGLCLLNCRNVPVVERAAAPAVPGVDGPPGSGPGSRYHVLEVELVTRVLDGEGRAERGGLLRAVHLVRGHIKDYSRGPGLFGRVRGAWFWGPAVRGTPSAGVLVKDYALSGQPEVES